MLRTSIAGHVRLCAGREDIPVAEPDHVGMDRTALLSGLMVALRLRVYLVLRRDRLRLHSNGDPHISLRVLFP